MNISYTYHKSYLIVSGVILTLLIGITLNLVVIAFYYYLFINYIILRILTIPVSLIWNSIIGLGIYFIIVGTFRYEFHFSETHFKFYKNSRLRIDVPVEEIKIINITRKWRSDGYGGEYEYFKIDIRIGGKFEVRLTIAGTRRIAKFLIFAKLLQIYCFKKQIRFFSPRLWLLSYDRLNEFDGFLPI